MRVRDVVNHDLREFLVSSSTNEGDCMSVEIGILEKRYFCYLLQYTPRRSVWSL